MKPEKIQRGLRVWPYVLAAMAFIVGCGAPGPATAQVSSVLELRGFQIEFGLVSEKKRNKLLPSLDKQIDIVERAQVPPEVMRFFHSIPIIIDPKLTGSKGHAQKLAGQQIVTLQDGKMPSDRPILLHELLHGYFAVKLRGATPIIPKTFRTAQDSNYYPKNHYHAHFMENANEYFAVTSSIFLTGTIDQPPFNCRMLRKHHPDFIKFLESQFGPHECK